MNEELKPCPFCGSSQVKANLMGHGWTEVYCGACEAEGPPRENEKDANAAWNKRND